MKIIIENRYIVTHSFATKRELDNYLSTQNVKCLLIDDHQGEFYCCHVICNSFNKEKIGIIAMSTDSPESEMLFLFWHQNDLMLLKNEDKIYLVDSALNLKQTIVVFPELIGIYIVNNEQLLVIEEIGVKIINSDGLVIKDIQTDLITKVDINEDKLLIFTDDGEEKLIVLGEGL